MAGAASDMASGMASAEATRKEKRFIDLLLTAGARFVKNTRPAEL